MNTVHPAGLAGGRESGDQLAVAGIAKVRRNHTPEHLAALREAFIANRSPRRNQGSLF
jgi:hypothetical protein